MTPREANAALRRLPDAAKRTAQQVMDTTAYRVMTRAKANAPIASGRLRRAIQWKSRPATVSAVVGVTTDAMFGAFDAFYWKFVEYGTVHQPARPFMRPAAMSVESDHEARLTRALSASADSICSGGSGLL